MTKQLISFLLLAAIVTGCRHQNPETSVLNPATPVIDPVNYPPAVTQTLPNAIQLNYGTVTAAKSMTLTLSGITPAILSNHSVHIYLKSGGKYLHLPGKTDANVIYNYTLKSAAPYCSVTITRAPGTNETFDDIIMVAANFNYLSTLNPPLNFTDYGTVKIRLGF